MPSHHWPQPIIDQIVSRYPGERAADIANDLGLTTLQVYRLAYRLGLRKTDDFFSVKGGRFEAGESRGAGQWFKPGQAPHNKGLRTPGYCVGRMAETQFKIGGRSGKARELHAAVGTYRIADGYLQQKINDGPVLHRRWKAVHRIVWEHHNVTVPPSHVVSFKPGRKTTQLDKITIDALELISRSELAARNSIVRYPPELRSAIRAVAQLKREIRRHEEQNH